MNQHRGQWKAIAPSSGVSYSWLSKFARGCIDNPGYATLRRVQMLLREGPSIAGTVGAEAVETNTTRPRRAKRLIPQEA